MRLARLWPFATVAMLMSANSGNAQQLAGFDLALAKLPPFPVTAFYDVSADLSAMPVGTIVRQEEIEAPAGAVAWRLIYVSETWDGRHVPASGLVIAPKSASSEPRKVFAWAHGTVGAARGCAPSLAPRPARELTERSSAENLPIDIGVPFLGDWLNKGYVVVAPDYAGLGTGVGHHFLVGEEAARDVFNLVRAARSIKTTQAGNDLVVMGWSQGGQAALFTGEIVRAYAPETRLHGIVGMAPGATIMFSQIDGFFKAPIPYVYLIGQSYIDAYGLDSKLFTDAGQQLLEASRNSCVVALFSSVQQSKVPGVTKNISDDKRWIDALTRNDSGRVKSAAPVFIVHGRDDTIVLPGGTDLYAERARGVGTEVSIKWVDGADHRSIFAKTKDDVLAWVDQHVGAKKP